MCEAVILSNRNKKVLFVPQIGKKSRFSRENRQLSENKAEILAFIAKQAAISEINEK